MAKINPNDTKLDDTSSSTITEITVTPGAKLLAPVGASFRYSMSGKRYCEIRFVVIKNLEQGGPDEQGGIIEDKYFLEENNNWVWSKLAACLMFNESFDNEDPQDVQNMLFRDGCRIKAKLVEKTYNGKTTLRIGDMGRVLKDGKVPPYHETELQLIASKKDSYNGLLKWRSENGWKQDLLPMSKPNDPLSVNEDDFGDDGDDWDTVPF